MMATNETDINKYKEYIHQHALRYVPAAPDRNDPTYSQWLQKLQKVEEVLHKKYMKKLARTLEQQTKRLHEATPKNETCQNSPFPDTVKVQLPSPKLKGYDDYFGFDGLVTPDGTDYGAAQAPPQQLVYDANNAQPNTMNNAPNGMNFQQDNERQKQIIDRLLMEQQQINTTKDNLQRIVVNQLNEISKLGQTCTEQEVLIASLKNQKEEMKQKYERLEAVHQQTLKEQRELKIKYAALKEEGDEKERSNNCEAWNTQQTVQWIVSLDEQRYAKYYDDLLVNMQKEGVDGDCLADLCKDDLYRFGIVQFKDKRDILRSIRQLIESKEDGKKEGGTASN